MANVEHDSIDHEDAVGVLSPTEHTTTDHRPFHGIRIGAGVPAGAPTTAELPLARDTTGGTGGFYYWSGAAWVKIVTIA